MHSQSQFRTFAGSRAFAAMLLLVAVSACTSADPQSAPLEGVWGGSQGRLTAAANAAAIEIVCAEVRTASPIVLDADGRFELPGTYIQIRGVAPSAETAAAPREVAVRVRGEARGNTLNLSFHFEDREPILGVVLTRGESGHVPQCG